MSASRLLPAIERAVTRGPPTKIASNPSIRCGRSSSTSWPRNAHSIPPESSRSRPMSATGPAPSGRRRSRVTPTRKGGAITSSTAGAHEWPLCALQHHTRPGLACPSNNLASDPRRSLLVDSKYARRHVVSVAVQCLPLGDLAMLSRARVRAIVFAGTGRREVMRLEQRPDSMPGSEELLVRARFAGVDTADLAQRAGAYPAPSGAPQDVPGLEVAGTVLARGAAVRDFAEGDRVFGLVGGGGL